jgi:hypothetical protein
MPYLLWNDGPFAGEPVVLPVSSPVSQTYQVRDFTLESHDPQQAGAAPVVVLKNKSGQVMWAVEARAYPRTEVSEIRFTDHRTLWHTTIRGRVKWTYGHETCWWIIDRSGKVVSYYYAW